MSKLTLHQSVKSLVILFLSIFITLNLIQAEACTRIFMNNNYPSIMVGRNMDWMADMKTNLWVFPRGIHRNGGGGNDKNPLEWTSKYGSIIAAAYDLTATDGFNEKGLAAHVLWLEETDYGARNENIRGLSVMMWLQFYLDNFASVNDAVNATNANNFQIIPYYFAPVKKWVNLHIALEDASGDSAVIEYINGMPQIYHGNKIYILTNSPTLKNQLQNLLQYQGFGGDKPIPGTTDSKDRFVRASYYLSKMSEANSQKEEWMQLMSILDNVAEPVLTTDPQNPHYGPTIWKTVSDLSQQTYYFKSYTSFNTIWANLSDFNLDESSSIMKLDLAHNPDLHGNVSKDFKPVSKF